MLERLRAGLNSFIEKISKTELKGEALTSAVEELKLTLIESDVAYSVADQISEKLKARLSAMQVPRFGERREPVKKVLKEILLERLQGSGADNFFALLENKRKRREPTVLLFIGVNGTGKCVGADTLIALPNRRVVTAEELYGQARGARFKVADEGEVVLGQVPVPPIYCADLRSPRIAKAYPCAVWKLKPTSPLVRVELEDGRSIVVTPEHPFYAIRNGCVILIRADEVAAGTRVLAVQKALGERATDSMKELICLKVRRAEREPESDFVYDLTVPCYHNFVANGMVVHNTTSIAKLAHVLNARNFSVVLACSDTYRTGSIEQLEEHARRLGVRTIKHRYGADAAAVAYDAINFARAKGIDAVLIDTAGRMQTDKNLLEEMKKIVRVTGPDMVFLVVDALTGNDAVQQGAIFSSAVRVDGIILTKLDADVKGGSAISISSATGKPIIFAGVGQRYDDLVAFNPEEVVSRILG